MSVNQIIQITESDLVEFEGKICPECGQGNLHRQLKHDAVNGNQLVLKCNEKNTCSYIIEVNLN